MPKSRAKFRIQTVAEMTGVPASTLRTWEQRYGFPSPDRTASAYRMYSQSDIDQIARVRELCDTGLGPAEAVQQLLGEEEGEEQGEVEGSPEAPGSAEPAPSPVPAVVAVGEAGGAGTEGRAEALVGALVGAIEAFDPARVEGLVRTALLVGSQAEAFEGWIWPAWRRVRERWLAGALGRHHERLAAELLGQAARDMIRLSRPPAPAPWAVLGCLVDEDDPGPALGAALALHGRGRRALFLGPRTRAAVVRDAVRALSAEVVGLSVTEAVSARGARDLVDDYAAAIGERPWFVTGPGVESVAAMVQGAGGHVAVRMAEVRALVG